MGRARLLAAGQDAEQASSDDWMEAISNQDDASIIYCFLRKQPSLCLPDPRDGSRARRSTDLIQGQALSQGSGGVLSPPSKAVAPSKAEGESNMKVFFDAMLSAVVYSVVFAAGYWFKAFSDF